jgi:hypothetical protein
MYGLRGVGCVLVGGVFLFFYLFCFSRSLGMVTLIYLPAYLHIPPLIIYNSMLYMPSMQFMTFITRLGLIQSAIAEDSALLQCLESRFLLMP